MVYQQVGMYKMMEESTYKALVYSVVASLGVYLAGLPPEYVAGLCIVCLNSALGRSSHMLVYLDD